MESDKPGFESQLNQALTVRPYTKLCIGACFFVCKMGLVVGSLGNRLQWRSALSSLSFHSGSAEAWAWHLGVLWGWVCAQEVRPSLQLSICGARSRSRPSGCWGEA